jgi:hypothetical protein
MYEIPGGGGQPYNKKNPWVMNPGVFTDYFPGGKEL